MEDVCCSGGCGLILCPGDPPSHLLQTNETLTRRGVLLLSFSALLNGHSALV